MHLKFVLYTPIYRLRLKKTFPSTKLTMRKGGCENWFCARAPRARQGSCQIW